MNELVGMSIGPQDNIAATAAVTAIRSSFGNEFLAPKTDTPASAPSGLRKNFDTIDKHGAGTCHSTRPLSSRAKRGTPQIASASRKQEKVRRNARSFAVCCGSG